MAGMSPITHCCTRTVLRRTLKLFHATAHNDRLASREIVLSIRICSDRRISELCASHLALNTYNQTSSKHVTWRPSFAVLTSCCKLGSGRPRSRRMRINCINMSFHLQSAFVGFCWAAAVQGKLKCPLAMTHCQPWLGVSELVILKFERDLG